MTYTQDARPLLANGYTPLPCKPGTKWPYTPSGHRDLQGKPLYLDWNSEPITYERISQWEARGYSDYGVSIRLGSELVALDIDVLDLAASEALGLLAQLYLGAGLVRIGKAPKQMLFYRLAWHPEGGFKKQVVTLIDPNGAKHIVEVLGDGQAAFSFGIHPDTQQPLTWPNGSLLDVPLAQLPEVTHAELEAFLHEVLPTNLPQGWSVFKKPEPEPWEPCELVSDGRVNKGQVAYAEKCFQRALDDLQNAPDGTRNNQLNLEAHLCFSLVKAGLLDETLVYRSLETAALNIRLEQAEITATLKSAWKSSQPKRLQDRPFIPERLKVPAEQRFEPWEVKPANDENNFPLIGQQSNKTRVTDSALTLPKHDTDLDMAQALYDYKFAADARYLPQIKRWVFWDGQRWAANEADKATTEASSFCNQVASATALKLQQTAMQLSDQKEIDGLSKLLERKVKYYKSASTINNTEKLSRSLPGQSLTLDVFDSNESIIGLKGQTLNLASGQLVPPAREHYITKQAGTELGFGTCPKWLGFLNRVFNNEPETVAFIQRLMGYCLTASTGEAKFFFCYGTGRNGKSVFFNLLRYLMGDYATGLEGEALIRTRNERHPTSIAALMGARVVIASELPGGSVWNVELLKKLTGGEPIKARKMGQDEFTFQPQLKLFMSGNEPPSLHDIDEAIKARLVLIPFDVTIPAEERDPLLFEKLKAEAPAIMAWVLEGNKAWKANGLGSAPACELATQSYLDEEAGLSHAGFIDDCLQSDPLSGVLSYKAVYVAYVKWAGEQGDPAMSKRRLCKLLKRNGLKTGRVGGSKGGNKGIDGYRLTSASFSPF